MPTKKPEEVTPVAETVDAPKPVSSERKPAGVLPVPAFRLVNVHSYVHSDGSLRYMYSFRRVDNVTEFVLYSALPDLFVLDSLYKIVVTPA